MGGQGINADATPPSLSCVRTPVDSAGITKYSYTAAGQLVTEIGPLSGMAVTNIYSNRLRVALQASGAWTNGFGYDTASRLTNIISPAGSFTNVYFTGVGGGYSSRLLQKLLLANGSVITNNFDPVARLLATHLRTSTGALTNKHEYQYDLAGERTNQTRIDGITVPYGYDAIGQLKTAFISGGATQDQWRYGYDPGWDMTRRTNGTSLAGVTTYTFNNDNELTWPNNPAYDINGNLISYGNLANVFDDENRLIQISDDVNHTFQTAFAYDGFGRLRTRTEYSWVDNGDGTGYWTETNSYNYLYDGWRVIEDGTANYTRGIDLSGTLEAAGGIGGLLARTDGSGSAYYHADASGNITCLLDGTQTQVAYYRYNDPYGFSVTASGSVAGANVYRFSSKEIHINSGLYYYGYRFYDPGTQRWPNRDPLGESSDINLYRAFQNGPSDLYDPTGLQITIPVPVPGPRPLPVWPGQDPRNPGHFRPRPTPVVPPARPANPGHRQSMCVAQSLTDDPITKEKKRRQVCNDIWAAQDKVCDQLHTPAARNKCHDDNQQFLKDCLSNKDGAYNY